MVGKIKWFMRTMYDTSMKLPEVFRVVLILLLILLVIPQVISGRYIIHINNNDQLETIT